MSLQRSRTEVRIDLRRVQTKLAISCSLSSHQRNFEGKVRSGSDDPSQHLADEVFGIDFRHAVEFSRSGRAPSRGLSSLCRGNCSNVLGRSLGVKPGVPLDSVVVLVPLRARLARRQQQVLRRPWWWGFRETVRAALLGASVRCSLRTGGTLDPPPEPRAGGVPFRDLRPFGRSTPISESCC
jgi:hypothetical protein